MAAHYETDGRAAERDFLLWLERQGPPSIAASPAAFRLATTSYVPVNDSKKLAALPEAYVPAHHAADRRARQARSFPSATPDEPVAWFIWPDTALEPTLSEACEALVARVAYLGHSSSFVHVRAVADPPTPTYEPADSGQLLRTPAPGQLEALDRAFGVFERTGIRGRLPSAIQPYRRVDATSAQPDAPPSSIFGELVAFRRIDGTPLPITAAARAAGALRGAVMAACPNPVPEAISGHRADGGRSERPHVAYAALPFVTPPSFRRRHADGHLVGVAAIIPGTLEGEDLMRTLRAFTHIERLTMGSAGAWDVERVSGEAPQRTLRAETWSRPATTWATATPVLLDRFPDRPYGDETEASISLSCVRIGLPEPADVRVGPTSALIGAEPWHRFLPPRNEARAKRPLVHAVVRFAQPVRGPLLLGSGRYYGLGLCHPLA